jgi:Ca2+-binding EF-hand superfamily protein
MNHKRLILHRIPLVRVTVGVAALFFAVNLCSAGNSASKDSFDLADANHDGKLSREEAGDYLVYTVFAARDKNRDGRLTQAEWAAGDRNQITAFKERDRNEDGFVTLEEAIVYGRRGGGAVALMRAADKNGDGRLTRAEIEAYTRQH